MDSGQVNQRIERVLGVLERRAAWIALCLLVPAGLVFFISKQQPRKYTATASLVFAELQLGRQGARRLSTASSQNRRERRSTNVKLLQLGDLATATAARVHLTTDQVRRAVHVRAQGDSNVVDVSGTAATPGLAAQIANAYALQFVTEQQAANRRYASALRLEAKRLGALFSKEGARSARLALQDLVQSLGTLADLRNGTVRVAQPAAIPRSKSSAGVFRDSAIAAGLGLLLGLAIALLLERLDSRIREPKELGDAYRAPVLGEVPQSAAFESASELISRASRELLPQREAEAFRRIRANLRYQKSEREPRTLLVTSAETGDGKTTVARHLAVVAAHMGSTVLLVEADLRHPCLAAQLDIAAGPGVADVLIGSVSLWRATQPVAIDRATGVAARPLALDVLVAGAWPPANPAELLESGAMAALLGQAHDSYDLVVLDTPPLSVVSDAFPLLGRVDGVVVVGRMGRNQRPAAEHLRETLERVGAPLLGVVANGVRARGGREPYYAEVDADLASAEGASAETGYERRVATGRPSPAGLSAATVDGAHRRLSQTATSPSDPLRAE